MEKSSNNFLFYHEETNLFRMYISKGNKNLCRIKEAKSEEGKEQGEIYFDLFQILKMKPSSSVQLFMPYLPLPGNTQFLCFVYLFQSF
jgi:hypothetical protein